MIIHVVQSGETIDSISEYYNIPVDRLILENGITNPDNLAIGQTIVINQPEILYTVKSGDTLESIARQYNTTPMEILRNNTDLADREYLYPGETLVISYQTNKTATFSTIGYLFSYIEKTVLKKTLPFLTYLSIFNYRITEDGEIVYTADDREIVDLARIYDVAPLMFVSTMSEEGVVNREVNYIILNNPSLQDRFIDNALDIMKIKGFYGINLYVENITFDNINTIAEYLKKAAEIFHSEGFKILITITPTVNVETSSTGFDKIDYSILTEFVDGVIFSSYDWAISYSYPNAIFPFNILIELLDYLVSIIPPEKIFLGVTALGYDWKLPYIPGATEATVISYNGAVQIAAEKSVPIQFNETAQSPYFYYMDINGILHIVWTKDARSFDARARLIAEYNLQGLSLWTVMKFDAQMWSVINSQYYIQKF